MLEVACPSPTSRVPEASPSSARETVVDDEIRGVPVPAGSIVAVLPYVVHHHPDHWPEPTRFRPERFAEATERHPAAWMPFGIGPRQCIGLHFALLEGQLALAMILQRYEFSAVPRRREPLRLAVVMRPHGGVQVRVSLAPALRARC